MPSLSLDTPAAAAHFLLASLSPNTLFCPGAYHLPHCPPMAYPEPRLLFPSRPSGNVSPARGAPGPSVPRMEPTCPAWSSGPSISSPSVPRGHWVFPEDAARPSLPQESCPHLVPYPIINEPHPRPSSFPSSGPHCPLSCYPVLRGRVLAIRDPPLCLGAPHCRRLCPHEVACHHLYHR